MMRPLLLSLIQTCFRAIKSFDAGAWRDRCALESPHRQIKSLRYIPVGDAAAGATYHSGTYLPTDGTSGTAPSQEILFRTVEAAKRAIRAGHFASTSRLQDLHGGGVALIDL